MIRVVMEREAKDGVEREAWVEKRKMMRRELDGVTRECGVIGSGPALFIPLCWGKTL